MPHFKVKNKKSTHNPNGNSGLFRGVGGLIGLLIGLKLLEKYLAKSDRKRKKRK